MSEFFKGVAAVLVVLALTAVVIVALEGDRRSRCEDLNYTVWAFESCLADQNSRCFVTPEMVEKYNRAQTEMTAKTCHVWERSEPTADSPADAASL